MPKLIMYILITMCLIGQIFVTKNKRIGYILWILADGYWAIFNFMQYKVLGALEQGILWSMYFLISTWGFIIWKKDKNEK